jgi:DNA-directed RNA polymerase specialized sigma subunit
MWEGSMTAKDLLCEYENCRLRENRLKNFISDQRKDIRSLKLIPCHPTRQMRESLSHIEEKLQSYEKDLDRISGERQKIHDLITEIPGLEGEVLTRRYVNGEIWEDICESMFYSWSYIHKLHKKALQMVQDRNLNHTIPI